MRLFEVDQGATRGVLAVLQGLANKPGSKQASELPWPVIQKIMQPFALGISTPDALIALKNQIDPAGDVIQDIKDDGTVILNTNVKDPKDQPTAQSKATGPSVDQMAKSNSDLSSKI
jgi:hypothetical protein